MATLDPLQLTDIVTLSTFSFPDWSQETEAGLGGDHGLQPHSEFPDTASLQDAVQFFFKEEIRKSTSVPGPCAPDYAAQLAYLSTRDFIPNGGPNPVEFGSPLVFNATVSQPELHPELSPEEIAFGYLKNPPQTSTARSFNGNGTGFSEPMQLGYSTVNVPDLAALTTEWSNSTALASYSVSPNSTNQPSPARSSQSTNSRR
jgi:hypothetical protein